MRRHTLHDQVRSENTHRRDTDTGLGGSIGSSQASEDNGSRAAHGTEERLQSLLANRSSDYQVSAVESRRRSNDFDSWGINKTAREDN